MYYTIVRQFAHTLRNLEAILAKADAYAQERGFPVDNFLTERLAPDMLPFVVQVRIACDAAKLAAANITQKEAPKFDDNETSVEQLRARINATASFLDSLHEADFANVDTKRLITVPYMPGKALAAHDYFVSRQIPNFFFHVSMTYALLRAGGVDIGKGDYHGALNFVNV